MTTEIRTACRSCHGGCGAIITMEDGIAVKIRPDPASPISKGTMCPKGLSALELLYHPDHLNYPMKRIGPKGSGQFERISWDEALDTIAEHVDAIRKEYGPESIVVAQGTGRHHLKHTIRFANALHTPNWMEPGTAQCFFPRICACSMTLGFFPCNDYYGPVNPGVQLIWGSNPVNSNGDGELAVSLYSAMRKGTKLIVVDPRRTELVDKAAYWLRLRPGTDDALALGFLHVLIFEDLYDHDFVEKWTVGFDKLRERVREYTPERVSEITWVPKEDLIGAARLYAAARPGGIEWGCALEHTPNCFQTVRAVSMIPVITGNLDVPGGWIENMHTVPEADALIEQITEEQGKKRFGEKEYPLLAGHGGACPASHVPTAINAMLTGKPYPVKGLLCFGHNGIISFADSQKVRKAYENVDFIAVMDQFRTPMAELADIVLPAASWPEIDELYGLPGIADHVLLCMNKVTRIAERRADEEVFIDLAKRLGLDYRAETIYDIFNEQLQTFGEIHPEYKGMTFDDLRKVQQIELPIAYYQYKKRGGFRTPSGKVELYASALEPMGYDPLPFYQEPPESPLSSPELLEEYPLVLTTGPRDRFFFISEGRQIPKLRRGSTYPRVDIHPETARKYGIEDGDWVWIETKRGKITQKCRYNDGYDPRVINCAMGWWYPEDTSSAHGWNESNCNILTSQDPPYDPMSGTYQLRGLLCRISKNEDCRIEKRFQSSALGNLVNPQK